jgi:CheY-like chemotaxis protein
MFWKDFSMHLLRIHACAMQGVRVLVAEDNLINQMVAKKMLAALGATVSVVNNGQEAVNTVCSTLATRSEDTTFDASQTDSSQTRDTESESACAFDVVLMDMAMPLMDGLQVGTTRFIGSERCLI